MMCIHIYIYILYTYIIFYSSDVRSPKVPVLYCTVLHRYIIMFRYIAFTLRYMII